MKNPTFATLKEMTDLFECNIHELITPPTGYKHEYNGNKWLGIVPVDNDNTKRLYVENNGNFTLIGSINTETITEKK